MNHNFVLSYRFFIFIIKDVMCVEYCKYMESIVSMNQEVCFFLV